MDIQAVTDTSKEEVKDKQPILSVLEGDKVYVLNFD